MIDCVYVFVNICLSVHTCDFLLLAELCSLTQCLSVLCNVPDPEVTHCLELNQFVCLYVCVCVRARQRGKERGSE